MGELEKRIADISSDWIVNQEKLKVMREALDKLASCEDDSSWGDWVRDIAKQALGVNK